MYFKFVIKRSSLQRLTETRIEATVTQIVEDAMNGTSIITKLLTGVEPMASLESYVRLLERCMEQDDRKEEWNGADDSRGTLARYIHYFIGKGRDYIPDINPIDREVDRRRKKAMRLPCRSSFRSSPLRHPTPHHPIATTVSRRHPTPTTTLRHPIRTQPRHRDTGHTMRPTIAAENLTAPR